MAVVGGGHLARFCIQPRLTAVSAPSQCPPPGDPLDVMNQRSRWGGGTLDGQKVVNRQPRVAAIRRAEGEALQAIAIGWG